MVFSLCYCKCFCTNNKIKPNILNFVYIIILAKSGIIRHLVGLLICAKLKVRDLYIS